MSAIANTAEPTAPEQAEAPIRKARRIWSESEREEGLTLLAYKSGNARAAARVLRAQGLPIPARTLNAWAKDSHTDLYRRIRLELAPHRRAAREERYRQLSRRFAGTEDTPTHEPTEAAQ